MTTTWDMGKYTGAAWSWLFLATNGNIPIDLERYVLTISIPEKDLQYILSEAHNSFILDIPDQPVVVIFNRGKESDD